MNGLKRGGFSLLRRAAAWALVLLLSLQLLPGRAAAAGGEWKTLDDTAKRASEGKTVENTYILEVSSGTRQGGGVADNVYYFIIGYTTEDGQARTCVVAPREDGISSGFALAAAQGNRNDRRNTVYDVFGYKTADLADKPALGSVQTDQLLFTTPDAVKSIDKIQIFGKRKEEHADWSCQGMRIYRVDTLYGLEMYGWYSDTGYIDFEGRIIAQVDMPSGGVTFKWTDNAHMYTLTSETAKGRLVSGTGLKHVSQSTSRVVFRIDFADTAGAGFETLAGSYEAGSHTRISDLKYCEVAALIVRYTDIYGCIREITLPLMVNALGQVMEVLGNAEIAEFAQQGDSIAIPAMLPDFMSLVSLNVSLGEEKAAEAAHIFTGPTKTDKADEEEDVFTIACKDFSGKVLTVEGSGADANVTISEYQGSSGQQWMFESAGDGYVFIRSASQEDLVLTTEKLEAADGTNVKVGGKIIRGEPGTQRIKLVDEGDGYYGMVFAVNQGQCINAQSWNVQAYKYNKTDNQKWKITRVNKDAEGSTPESVLLRSARAKKSKTDDISYLCFALYRDVTVQTRLEGATLRTRFTGGKPVNLSTATSAEGVPMAADQTAAILLRPYTDGAVLAPKDRMERYLITISTDNVPNAGTAADVYLQFQYVSMKNKELESAEYRVRDYVREFYGEWPGNTEDFAYNYGMRDGGTVQFMIPLQGVKQFRSVSVRVSGEDEWQFSGISIAMVKGADPETGERSFSARLADWDEIAVTGLNNHPGGLFSHLRYSRSVETETAEPAFRVGTVYEEEEPRPDPGKEDSGWEPGTLVQDDGDTYIFDGESREVTKKDDVPWDQLRHYMTYNDALQDLGFTKERCVYTVSVQVAGKTVNAGNDDCGSKNLFYFRLVFENGNSGCTLANQQIVGDAFGTGELVQFKIPTSQDYGEVTAVQVIPDAQDSNGDIYDKLQIEEISVTRDVVGAVSPTWTAKIAASEDEGWVGIDYRDPGESASKGGSEGRTLSELATTFPITETSYSTNLLVSITTGAYEAGDQFAGGLRMDLNYINAEGRTEPKPISGFDVVGAMNDYGGLTGSRTRRYKDGSETKTENASYYVSDVNYQFLPGSTDSFIVTIKNVSQLTDMTLTVYSDVVTQWTIKDVNVYQLNGQGIRYLNPSGSYAYRYKPGQEPTPVARWALDRVTTPLGVYDSVHNTSMQAIGFALDSETIQLSADAAKWSSRILREPNSHNDTLNLILYPSTGNGAADPEDYEVTAAVKYTDAVTTQTMQISAGEMQYGMDAAGRPVFCAWGLTANNLASIDGVEWSASILRSAQPLINEGVLQVVRGGVLIESYPLLGMGNALTTAVGTTAVSTQRLLLQVSEDVPRQTLKPNENDMAVALYFRTDDPSGKEYRSKYIFLSDVYDVLKPGQQLELDYSLGSVGELTGVNLVSMGRLEAAFDGIYLADQASDGSIRMDGGVRDKVQPGLTPIRVDLGSTVAPLTLILETAEGAGGTKDPIRLRVGYYDEYGTAKTVEKENIRLCVSEGSGFISGGTDRAELLIPDLVQLRWIELEPWHTTGDGENHWSGEEPRESTETPASWKLHAVTAIQGLDGSEVRRVTDRRILEGEPLRIGLSEIMLLGTVLCTPPAASGTGGEGSPEGQTPQTAGQTKLQFTTGDEESVTVDSGTALDLTVRVSGSDEGWSAALQSVNAGTGETSQASIDETHGYTKAELEALVKEAEDSAASAVSTAEKNAAQAVAAAAKELLKTTGKLRRNDETGVLSFNPPRNYTGDRLVYRLTVSAKEMPEARFTLDVTVRPEDDPLREPLRTWNAVRTAGTITLLNPEGEQEETAGIPMGGTRQQLVRSGGTMEISPHTRSGMNHRAEIRDLDPVTGATGPAELGETHGYKEERLGQLEAEAREILFAEDSTEELISAARAVLDACGSIRGTAGSFEDLGAACRFTAPRNYTGSTLYYRISVYNSGTSETLFNVDVAVKSETDPLAEAISRLNTAKSNAQAAKQAEAIQEAIESAGGNTYIIGGGDGDNPSGDEKPEEEGGTSGEETPGEEGGAPGEETPGEEGGAPGEEMPGDGGGTSGDAGGEG